MEKSTHKVEIVPIVLEKHPNADTLSIVKIWDYCCIVRTDEFKDIKLGAYVVPDSLVPNAEPFKFLFKLEDSLDAKYRVRVKKFRGVISQGLLLPAPKGSKVGQDIASKWGVTRYEPPMKGVQDLRGGKRFVRTRKVLFAIIHVLDIMHVPTQWIYDGLYHMGLISSVFRRPPNVYAPVYDVDSLLRYSHCFTPGEPVWVTEKIHGANARYVCVDDEIHCGSHKLWKPETRTDQWWSVVRNYPEVVEFIKMYPETVVYGEVYGDVQDLMYGCKEGEYKFVVFDILHKGKWLNPQLARDIAPKLPWVPLLDAAMPFDMEKLKALAEGNSTLPGANHIREGIVIKPLEERVHHGVGRVQFKIVSNTYLERSK